MMNLQENIRKILREEFKNNKLIDGIQSIVDQTILELRKESEEWGLGEMDDINQVSSLDNVEVLGLTEEYGKLRVRLMMTVLGEIYSWNYYEDIRNLIRYDIKKLIPTIMVDFDFKNLNVD